MGIYNGCYLIGETYKNSEICYYCILLFFLVVFAAEFNIITPINVTVHTVPGGVAGM